MYNAIKVQGCCIRSVLVFRLCILDWSLSIDTPLICISCNVFMCKEFVTCFNGWCSAARGIVLHVVLHVSSADTWCPYRGAAMRTCTSG